MDASNDNPNHVIGYHDQQVTDDQLTSVLLARGGNVDMAVNAYFSQQVCLISEGIFWQGITVCVCQDANSDVQTAVRMQHEQMQKGVQQMRAIIGENSNATSEVLEVSISAFSWYPAFHIRWCSIVELSCSCWWIG